MAKTASKQVASRTNSGCKKRKRPKTKHYTVDQLISALNDVRQGELSVKKAAEKWGVPRSTLTDKKLGRSDTNSRPGPCTVLTADEEALLCEWIAQMSHRALPITKRSLLDSIQAVLTESPRPNPFVKNRPGNRWFDLFMKRYPCVADKHAESISRSRGALTAGCIRGWFSDVEKFF